jgi:hypothetical protein
LENMGSHLGPGLGYLPLSPEAISKAVPQTSTRPLTPSFFPIHYSLSITHSGFFCPQNCPNRLWSQNSPLFSGYRCPFCRWHRGCLAKLTAGSHIVPRLRMSGAIPPFPYAFIALTGTTVSKHSITLLRYCILTLKQAMKAQKRVDVQLYSLFNLNLRKGGW